jgi:hypothetical protein
MKIARWMILEREKFQTIGVEEITPHFTFHNFSSKWCRLLDSVEKYGRAKQATDDITIRRMRFAAG